MWKILFKKIEIITSVKFCRMCLTAVFKITSVLLSSPFSISDIFHLDFYKISNKYSQTFINTVDRTFIVSLHTIKTDWQNFWHHFQLTVTLSEYWLIRIESFQKSIKIEECMCGTIACYTYVMNSLKFANELRSFDIFRNILAYLLLYIT